MCSKAATYCHSYQALCYKICKSPADVFIISTSSSVLHGMRFMALWCHELNTAPPATPSRLLTFSPPRLPTSSSSLSLHIRLQFLNFWVFLYVISQFLACQVHCAPCLYNLLHLSQSNKQLLPLSKKREKKVHSLHFHDPKKILNLESESQKNLDRKNKQTNFQCWLVIFKLLYNRFQM